MKGALGITTVNGIHYWICADGSLEPMKTKSN
jgi:hypothetical protein